MSIQQYEDSRIFKPYKLSPNLPPSAPIYYFDYRHHLDFKEFQNKYKGSTLLGFALLSGWSFHINELGKPNARMRFNHEPQSSDADPLSAGVFGYLYKINSDIDKQLDQDNLTLMKKLRNVVLWLKTGGRAPVNAIFHFDIQFTGNRLGGLRSEERELWNKGINILGRLPYLRLYIEALGRVFVGASDQPLTMAHIYKESWLRSPPARANMQHIEQSNQQSAQTPGRLRENFRNNNGSIPKLPKLPEFYVEHQRGGNQMAKQAARSLRQAVRQPSAEGQAQFARMQQGHRHRPMASTSTAANNTTRSPPTNHLNVSSGTNMSAPMLNGNSSMVPQQRSSPHLGGMNDSDKLQRIPDAKNAGYYSPLLPQYQYQYQNARAPYDPNHVARGASSANPTYTPSNATLFHPTTAAFNGLGSPTTADNTIVSIPPQPRSTNANPNTALSSHNSSASTTRDSTPANNSENVESSTTKVKRGRGRPRTRKVIGDGNNPQRRGQMEK